MVMSFGLIAGASAVGVYNWAASIYTYNRDAWMTDIQLDQAHAYQEDNLRIAMKNMDREEVRDLMSSDINKINNVILVTTLILSLAGEMLFEGEIPDNCAAFVLNAYMLCLGSAILHLVLSILFGMYASNEAYATSARMLTNDIRPAWEAHFKKLDRRRTKEVTSTFEKKPVASLLMPPLASRLKKAVLGNGSEAAKYDSIYAEAPTPFRRKTGDIEAARLDAFDPDVHEAWTNDPNHGYRDAWRDISESAWVHYKQYSIRCAALGAKNLLESCGYFCIARLYGSNRDAWAFWAVQAIFVTLNIVMMQFLLRTRSMAKGLVVATGPLACAMAATTSFEMVDRVCIPLCYASHVLVTTFLLQHPEPQIIGQDEDYDPTEKRQKQETTYYFNNAAESCDNDNELLNKPLVDPGLSRIACGQAVFPVVEEPLQELARQVTTDGKDVLQRIPHLMIVRGLCVVCILWGSAFCWALYGAIWGMDFKNSMATMPRWTVGPEVADLTPVPMAFPSPYFQPHALVCPRGQIFLADNYRVFQLRDSDRGVEPYDCDVNGTIADLASTCNAGDCWPVVLMHGDPPIVLDCRTGVQRRLLQTSLGVNRFAVGSDGLVLYAASDAANEALVVQYQWQSRRAGWAPFWDVAQVQTGLRALDVVDKRLLLFTRDGTVQAKRLDTGMHCGTWALPATLMGAGCGVQGSDSILILVRNKMGVPSQGIGYMPVSLMEARLPDATASCGSNGHAKNISRQSIIPNLERV